MISTRDHSIGMDADVQKGDEVEDVTENSEGLPFALPEHSPQHKDHSVFSDEICLKSTSETLNSSSSSHPPPLASSVISNPDDSVTSPDQIIHTDSQMLDAGASVLQSRDLRMSCLLSTPTSTFQPFSAPESLVNYSGTFQNFAESATFSQLLDKADDRIPQQSQLDETRLPVLSEEDTVASQEGDGLLSGFHELSGANCLTPPCDFSLSTHRSLAQTIVPRGLPITEERRLASLAGASAYLTGPLGFTVCLDLSGSTQRDVLDILSNPEILRLWFDPVSALVVCESSREGQTAPGNGREEVDGMWISATTNQLIVPSSTSAVFRGTRGLCSAIGFPSYGKLNMFVERQRSRVGLQLGPFPGNVQVAHTLEVQDGGGGKIRVVDNVQISASDTSTDYCGGIWGLLERCLLPSTDKYMDQTLTSMARLRFLVEGGEQDANYSTTASSPLLVSPQ